MALPYTKLSTRLARARGTSLLSPGEALRASVEDPPGSDESDSDSGTLLAINRFRTGRSIVMVLRGELDLFSRPYLEREFRRVESAGLERLVVDLSQLDFMDGAGMHALLGAQRRAVAAGRQFLLRRGSRDVHRLFVLAGVEPLFSFEAAPSPGAPG